MCSVDDDETRASLLAALRRPASVDDWVAGVHYTATYLPQLERVVHASTASASIRRPATRPAHRTATKSAAARQQLQQQRQADTVAPVADAMAADAVATTRLADAEAAAPATSVTASSDNAVSVNSNNRNHSDKVVRRQRQGQGDMTARCAALLTPRLGEGGLNAQEVRAQLCESYYCMKHNNAFGQTFPPLLTPLTRSLMHYYTEDEWAQRTRTTSAQRDDSKDDIHTVKSSARSRVALRGATSRTCVLSERSLSSTMTAGRVARLARMSWRTADTTTSRDGATMASASLTQ